MFVVCDDSPVRKSPPTSFIRLRVSLAGAVQGVGFRPFVFRLATELGLRGWVLNSSGGLVVEAEGPKEDVEAFLRRLDCERPAPAMVLAREVSRLTPAGYAEFRILSSDDSSPKTTAVLPDLATCPDCLAELFDATNRRHRYAFTNCTRCGPRYTIVTDIPYDRPNTTMAAFRLCADCAAEYTDPKDRRFHAQPNACPLCGPSLSGSVEEAAQALAAGRIVALKGIGGFQLLADARSDEAVERLRQLKRREGKPFAMMMPDLDTIRRFCLVSPDEEALLCSSAAPIVLLTPLDVLGISWAVSRSSPRLGVMLPYSPLHHLLMRAFPFPIVATSGNLSDEPIATDNDEAFVRLSGIADLFVTHNRPIARPCDDSVAQVLRGRESVVRRARGYAPLPVYIRQSLPPILAVGGHLKNSVAIAAGRQVFLSQHVGDLDTIESREAFERAIEDLCRLYRFEPTAVACDLHPDYASTRWAQSCGLPVVLIQHHQAHVAACAAENDVQGRYLGIAWDGTGYGLDGTIWGGEIFLVGETMKMERVAHLRPFRLPGGEAAIREGWRTALSLCQSAPGTPAAARRDAILRMLERNVNTPWTTSVGRLFDAVASLTNIAHENRFEGQAAMMLERAIDGYITEDAYPFAGDWEPLVAAIRHDIDRGVPAGLVAARFHNSLVDWIAAVAVDQRVSQVVLSGGVFQNRYLTERAAVTLECLGMAVYTHQRIPTNDGGIALGQIILAAAAQDGESGDVPGNTR